ncbi:putative gustatory receptor 36a [Drosophila eugracilis]|uniref:putative gustatory receptor 36a n=1 Tax=Drosophila eugracilis TaxID=29029 RepID=UPI001BDAED2F|nr:putative gustatory receptor 36a [Drosophila eugracilis]
MSDWAGLLLKVIYYYGHLIGLSNFEIDWRRGRVFTSKNSTLLGIAINFIIFILIFVQSSKQTNFGVFIGKGNKLHLYAIMVMVGLRMTSGLCTVMNRWRQRARLMRLARKVLRLYLAKPQVKRISRWGILIKVVIAIITDFLQIALTWNSVARTNSNQSLGLTLQFWMSAIINLATSQHYLITLFVRAYYHLLNTELRQVINECIILSHLPVRKGCFMTRCCSLADQVDNIARIQSQLQSIVTELNEFVGIQGLMVYSGYYVFSIITTYFMYSITKSGLEDLQLTISSVILAISWCFFYYLDAMINLFIMLNVLDDHNEMKRLLEERTLFASGLDVRLEESFESIQLQIIRNSFKIDVNKLFSLSRSSATAMFGSIITHSIFLIQYDMEYF